MGETIKDTLTEHEKGIKSPIEENNNSKKSGDVPDHNHKMQGVCKKPLPWISPPSSMLQALCSQSHKRVGECKRSVFIKLNSVKNRLFRLFHLPFPHPHLSIKIREVHKTS